LPHWAVYAAWRGHKLKTHPGGDRSPKSKKTCANASGWQVFLLCEAVSILIGWQLPQHAKSRAVAIETRLLTGLLLS
jgi:hypothetical protein